MAATILDLLVFAQMNQPGQNPFGQPGRPPVGGGGMDVVSIATLVFQLAIAVLVIASLWRIFTKAGEPGWAAIIPIYNVMVLSKICGRGMMFGLLCLIPCVNIVILIILYFDLAKVFGKGAGFAIGLILLGFIFMPILAFGDAEYIGADDDRPRSRRRRSRDDDDEDEDEDDRPRARRRRDDDEDEDEDDRPRRRPAALEDRPRRPAGPPDDRVKRPAPPPAAPPKRRPVDDDDDEEEERPRPRRK